MNRLKIAYVIYILSLLGVCTLCAINILNNDMVIVTDIILISIIFLFCSNMFYVPRNMDNDVFLENKQKMKSDPILWREMIFLETPLVVLLFILIFLIK